MNDATQSVAAQGTLAKTPFAHLVLYLYQRRSSGTLILSATAADRFETKVLFHRGRAVAAHLAHAAPALDEGLLPLCGMNDGDFAFHESDLVGSGPAIVTGMFDPFAFVAESARRHARPDVVQEVLARFADTPLSLQPAMDLTRLSLTAAEAQFAQPLTRGAMTIESLCAESELEVEAARRLLYVLLITKIVGPHVADSSESSVRPGVGSVSQAPSGSSSASAAAPAGPSSITQTERSRSSGAAWRAIASRAAEIATDRPSSAPRSSGPGSPPPSSGSGSHATVRPSSRPLSPSPRLPQSRTPSRTSSRPMSPSPFRSVTPGPSVPPGASVAPGAGPPSGTAPTRVTPRPSPAPLETLDAPNKFRRVEQLCQRHAYDEALPIIRDLIEEDRRSAKYVGMLSHVLLGLSTDGTTGKEIVETVNHALRLDPNEVHALYTKARCYKRMGKEREALHYFRRTIIVEPNHIEATREIRLLLLRMSEKRKR
jgi:hypothetical protein